MQRIENINENMTDKKTEGVPVLLSVEFCLIRVAGEIKGFEEASSNVLSHKSQLFDFHP
ncbi:MAG: hypothetical protein ABIT58_08755 [Ferruginibacter sp.]